MKYFLIRLNELIVGTDVKELTSFVTDRFPDAQGLPAKGKHTDMPWDIDTVFVVPCESSLDGGRTVAYLWREA